MDAAERYGKGSEMLVFSRQNWQENGTESEKLRRQQTTTDSSAVLFQYGRVLWVGLKTKECSSQNKPLFMILTSPEDLFHTNFQEIKVFLLNQ